MSDDQKTKPGISNQEFAIMRDIGSGTAAFFLLREILLRLEDKGFFTPADVRDVIGRAHNEASSIATGLSDPAKLGALPVAVRALADLLSKYPGTAPKGPRH